MTESGKEGMAVVLGAVGDSPPVFDSAFMFVSDTGISTVSSSDGEKKLEILLVKPPKRLSRILVTVGSSFTTTISIVLDASPPFPSQCKV